MDIAFPYAFDGRGRTSEVATERHVRDLIEQVLFTAPGERVNRPTFGCGLGHLVFEPLSTELATATQFLVQASLTEWLGELIQVGDVTVDRQDATLLVTVSYALRRTGEAFSRTFEVPGGAP
ncbi:MAG: hypothetical protein GC151_07730 [Betaproteobacteria bacterium]|nr:hypothetical protein [Betaproteobacteria bacterium]